MPLAAVFIDPLRCAGGALTCLSLGQEAQGERVKNFMKFIHIYG